MTDPDSPTSSVAVITVSFGSGGVLPGFLESVGQAASVPPKVVVVDNRAQPSSSVEALSAAAGVDYLPSPSNRGYGAAINTAAATLGLEIDWLLVSNPDVVLGAGSIDRLLRTARSDDRIGAVGPSIHTGDGARYPSARAVPSLRTGIGHALFANLWASNPWTRAYHNDRVSSAVERDAGWLSGACLLVRREAFDAIGGFDESFFMYFEDVDLGDRLGRAGYRNVYEPAASVVHSGAHATTSESAAMIKAHHDSALRFLSKRYRGPLLWPIRLGAGIGLSARSALLRRRTTP